MPDRRRGASSAREVLRAPPVGAGRARRRPSTARSAVVASSTVGRPVRSRPAMRSSSRRFQVTSSSMPRRRRRLAPRRAGCSDRQGTGVVERAAARGCGWRPAPPRAPRPAATRSSSSATRSGCTSTSALEDPAHPVGVGRLRDEVGGRHGASWQVGRDQLGVAAAPLAAVSSSPCAAADVPISIGADEAPRQRAPRARPPAPSATMSRRRATTAAGIGLRQRVGLGDEAGSVVGGVPDHRLGVDGQPRLPRRRRARWWGSGRRAAGRGARRRRAGSRIVSSARRAEARVGARVCVERGPRARRPRRRSTDARVGRPGGRRDGVQAGADRRAHPAAASGVGLARRRGVTGSAALDQQGAPIGDRGRTAARRRRRPTPPARGLRVPTPGVGAGA